MQRSSPGLRAVDVADAPPRGDWRGLRRPLVLSVNGRFAAQRTTGVQRVAERLVRALDAQADPQDDIELVCPPGARQLPLEHVRQVWCGPAWLPLHAWEQCWLPWAARGRLLLNLAGSAPVAYRRIAYLMHDAAPFDCAPAYGRLFGCWYRWVFRRMARHAEVIWTISRHSRERLSVRLGSACRTWPVIAHGADHLDEFSVNAETEPAWPWPAFEPGSYLLAVASISPTKGLDVLIRAHQALGPGRPSLILVGGANPAVFRSVGLVVADDVHLLGAVEDPVLARLYRHALVHVCASRYEGFGLTLLEAMQAGCPVICSDAASLPEVAGDAARLFSSGDVQSLEGALREVIEDAGLRSRMSHAGRIRAAAFRWADAASAVRGLLEARA